MKTKILVTLFAAGAFCGGNIKTAGAQDMDSFAPVVVKTDPEAGSTNVPPGNYIVHITFSKEMMDQSWSWSTVWKDSAPEIIGSPNYSRDRRVCAAAVKLEPGKTYGWWLNSEKFHGFKDKQGQAAVPYLLTFQTASQAAPAGQGPAINPATGMPASSDSGASLRDTGVNASYEVAREVHQLIGDGQYEDALQRCLDLHEKYKTSASLIPLLSDWIELGRRYPKARQALLEIRDKDAQEFAEGRGFSELFSEVSMINQYLGQEDSTYKLFNSIRDTDPQLAQQCYFYVEGLLVAKSDYQYCYDHMGSPQGRFDSIRRGYDMQMTSQKRFEEAQKMARERMAEMDRPHGWTNLPSYSPPDTAATIKNSANDRFVGQTRQLIEILVATGHKPDAEKIRDEAVAVLDDARLKSAVSDAEARTAALHGK